MSVWFRQACHFLTRHHHLSNCIILIHFGKTSLVTNSKYDFFVAIDLERSVTGCSETDFSTAVS
jgi:hypothetical protein